METGYKEKYEQALAKAKEQYNYPCMRSCMGILEEIFPELVESEDEKVRKEIIDFLKLPHPQFVGKRDHEKWIAWLEKQKEYESTDFEYVWDRTDCGELTAALDKYSEEAIINMCHAWYDKGIELERKSWLEKQGQVKESTISQHDNKMCKENDDSLTSEDEKIRKALIKLFEIENLKRYVLVDGIDIEDVLGWLERQGEHANFLSKIQVGDKVTRNEDGVLVNLSQLNRVAKKNEKQGEGIDYANKEYWRGYREGKKEILDKYAEQSKQKSVEWSEEDEQRLNSCLNILQPITFVGYTETINTNWLKSIKDRVQPQNRWKPSEGDIIILEKLIKGELEPKVFQATLQGILEQLKKLKEG